MSNVLFRSRQQKLRRNIKGLLILPPVMSNTSPTLQVMPNRSAVVLKAVYNFDGESTVELSIKKGDFLRFIDKPGNGWLKVQRVENSDCGLVPAAYVTIEVNDPFTPISREWLCEITPRSTPVEASFPTPKSQPIQESRSRSSGNRIISKRHTQETNTSNESDFDFFQRDRVDSVSSPISLNFQFSNITVLQVLQCDERFYYRIDYLRDGYDRRYVTKTYQDFYNLHVTLLEISIEQSLPKLPQPVRQQTKSLLLIRCNELNVYINKLSMNKFFKNCNEFVQWLDIDDHLHNEAGLLTDDDEINQMLLPGLINILQQRGKYSTTAPLPKVDSNGSRSASFSGPTYRDLNKKYSGYLHQSKKGMVNLPLDQTLNSYSLLIDGYDEKSDKQSEKNEPTTSYSDSEGDNSSVFLDHIEGPHTPIIDGESTPMFVTPPLEKLTTVEQSQSPLRGKKNVHGLPAPNPIVPSREYVKVKVLLNNKEQDIILLKVNKDIDSVTALKQQLSEKVYKDRKLIQHYALEFGGTINEDVIIEKIRSFKKVNLKMVRVK